MQQNFEGIQNYLNEIPGAVPEVTSLPASPTNRMVVDYVADDTNGVVWRFRYRAGSGSSYKWEFVGGSPLWSEITTLESYGAGVTTYGDLATVGPSIALPFAGDYEVEIGCSAYHNTTARAAWMSYQIGGTGASDNDGLVAVYAGLTNSVDVAGVRPRIKTGLGAVTLTAKYRGDGSGVPTFRNRWMRVTPRRIS